MTLKHAKKHKIDITDVLMWGGIIIILLWATGKSIGWISSPVWVDMIPMYGAAGTLAGICICVGRTLQKLDTVVTEVNRLSGSMIALDRRVSVVETQVAEK